MFSTKTFVTMAAAATTALAHSGAMSFYNPSAGLGACGFQNQDADMVVGLAHAQYGDHPNPNNAPCCQKTININYNGKTTTATVVDMCPTCADGGIDVSPAVFQQLVGDLGSGPVGVTWEFV